MPHSTEALAEPSILTWARSTAGYSIEDAAARLQIKPEKVLAWEGGEERPSMAQLRKMAVAYKRLLSDFYLPAAPKEAALPHDFRRLPGQGGTFHYSQALRYQLRLARQRRELALDLATELETDVPVITERFHLGSDTEQTGAHLRRLLGVSLATQRTWRDPRNAYKAWRTAIEGIGVLVLQAPAIPTKEMLGFTLSERPLPVIGVNRKLRPNGRTFTLLHESVHVFLEKTGLCDIEEAVLRPPEEQSTEVFCNAVGAAALVPFDALLMQPLVYPHPARPRDWSSDELAALAREFSVSEEVILRRLLTAGRTSQGFYMAKRAAWGHLMDDTSPPDPDAEIRRNIPQEVVSNLGKPFTRLVVDSYLNSFTSLSDVSRYLGLRAAQLPKVQELLTRG